MEPILEAKKLNLWYGPNHALHDVSIAIPEHEITAFIGPSGWFYSDHHILEGYVRKRCRWFLESPSNLSGFAISLEFYYCAFIFPTYLSYCASTINGKQHETV